MVSEKDVSAGQIAKAIAIELLAKFDAYGLALLRQEIAAAAGAALAEAVAKKVDWNKFRQELAATMAEQEHNTERGL